MQARTHANPWQKFVETGKSDAEPAIYRQPEPKRRPPISAAQKRALQRARGK